MSVPTDGKVYLFASLFLVLSVVFVSGCGPSPRDERAALDRRVEAMLGDLRNHGITRRIIEEYFADRPSMTRLERHRGLLIHRLKEVKGQEPEFSDDYTRAVYESAEFVKEEGTWYLESVNR